MSRIFANVRKRSRGPCRTAATPVPRPAAAARVGRLVTGSRVQAKLQVGAPDDAYEREADRVADEVMRAPRSEERVQLMCDECEQEQLQRQPIEEEEEELQMRRQEGAAAGRFPDSAGGVAPEDDPFGNYGGASVVHLKPSGESGGGDSAANQAARAVRSGGHPLAPETVREMESHLGHGFQNVRVHTDEATSQATTELGARAFTIGSDIGFASREYAPSTTSGRRLLAHELTHVVQQGAAGSRAGEGGSAGTPGEIQAAPELQMDLATRPPNPSAVARELTEAELAEAVGYNQFRFKDPYSLAVFRDVIGMPRFPAVADEQFARTIAQWQAEFNLTIDGQAGPATTRTLVAELRAEGAPGDANQLRRDNYVSWATVNPPVTRSVPTPAAHGLFRWDVTFDTSLRDGWIVQRIDNTWNENLCGGTAHPNPPTPQYWEAWWVNNRGQVRLPTSVATPPTHVATPAHDDRWQRGLPRGTRGNFSMGARLYTTLTLPAGFAIPGVADAGALPATTAPPNPDDLGQVEARRTATGAWNGCPPPAVNSHTGSP